METKVMPDLNVTMAGVRFRSPVGIAALGSHFGKDLRGKVQENAEANAEILLKHVRAGAGYVNMAGSFITEATLRKVRERARPEEKHPWRERDVRVLRAETPFAPYGVEGIFFHVSPFWVDYDFMKMAAPVKERMMTILKEKLPEGVPIIANTTGLGDIPETYIDGAKRWEELGVDLIEVNLSCPVPPAMHGGVDDFFQKKFPARFQGALLGEHPEIVEEITSAVVKAVKIPVGVKLSPETGFPRIVGIVKASRDAGAKFVQVINGAVSIPPPDIYNRGKSPWQFADGNFFALASGSWLRMLCYRDIAAIARFVPGIDIAAAGGLVIPEHCVEAMMLGASLTQLCTGVIEQGRSLITRSNDFLRKFMVEEGYQSLSEIIGLAQQHIKYQEDVNFGKALIEIDDEKCTRCGRCVNSFCMALYSDHGKIAVNEERCAGCGGCIIACQHGALKLVLKKQAVPVASSIA